MFIPFYWVINGEDKMRSAQEKRKPPPKKLFSFFPVIGSLMYLFSFYF
jgi:hypothetical protein